MIFCIWVLVLFCINMQKSTNTKMHKYKQHIFLHFTLQFFCCFYSVLTALVGCHICLDWQNWLYWKTCLPVAFYLWDRIKSAFISSNCNNIYRNNHTTLADSSRASILSFNRRLFNCWRLNFSYKPKKCFLPQKKLHLSTPDSSYADHNVQKCSRIYM